MAYQVVKFFIFTEKLTSRGPVDVYKLPGMEDNMICISGDKGDAAKLLGLPVMLFDDKAENLDVIIRKAVGGSV